MALIAALRRVGTAYFLVGDDWQSIYRFAGSDVGLVRDCGSHLGFVCERHLSRTFRYRAGILDPSAKFVQRNPEQTQRRLDTQSTAPARTPESPVVTGSFRSISAQSMPPRGARPTTSWCWT